MVNGDHLYALCLILRWLPRRCLFEGTLPGSSRGDFYLPRLAWHPRRSKRLLLITLITLQVDTLILNFSVMGLSYSLTACQNYTQQYCSAKYYISLLCTTHPISLIIDGSFWTLYMGRYSVSNITNYGSHASWPSPRLIILLIWFIDNKNFQKTGIAFLMKLNSIENVFM